MKVVPIKKPFTSKGFLSVFWFLNLFWTNIGEVSQHFDFPETCFSVYGASPQLSIIPQNQRQTIFPGTNNYDLGIF